MGCCPPGGRRCGWHPLVFAWRQPFRWRCLPDTRQPAAAAVLPTVVLVHGFVCNRGFWLPWMRELRRAGQAYVSVNLEPVFGSIDDYVPLIEDAVGVPKGGGAAARAGVPQHGRPGGARLAGRGPANGQRVSQVITIGTPHHGTWLGQFSHVPNGRQMRIANPGCGRWQQPSRNLRPEHLCAVRLLVFQCRQHRVSRPPPPRCPARTTVSCRPRPMWPWPFTPG
jgi:triacylglycerol lipase